MAPDGKPGPLPHRSAPDVDAVFTAGPGAATWCRACGLPTRSPGPTCEACGWSLEAASAPHSWVGMVFAMPGKLLVNKKRGVCIAADQQAVELHFSAVDTQVVPVANLPAFDEAWSRPDLSPSARLQHAARQVQQSEVKASWDSAALAQLAGSWANVSVAAMRQVADEALTMGWPDVFEWIGLTPAEKSWRQAHHAASVGDSERLLVRLSELSSEGYPERLRLCLPFLAEMVARPNDWQSVIDACCSAASDGEPGADIEVLETALTGDAETGLRRFGEVLADRGYDERGRFWQDTADRLVAGTPGPPPDRAHPAWAALSRYLTRSEPLTTDQAFSLTPALLDDAIETGCLHAETTFEHLDQDDRRYLEARLRPEALDLDTLERAGHHDELARRAFLAGDRARLDQLPDSEVVEHYRQLFNLALGQSVDLGRVRSGSRRGIEAAIEALGMTEGDAPIELPPEVVTDPSLWNLFVGGAQRGAVGVSDAQRFRAPRFADWVALHKLVGLLNGRADEEAVEAGRSLMASIELTERRGEAASLTAAALDRLGRSGEAYDVLEAELSSHYSLGLWFNAAVLADKAKPEVARHYWEHLARALEPPEAWAALARATAAPNPEGADGWSDELIAAAKEALRVCDLESYARIFSAAVTGSRGLIMESAGRGGEFDPVRDLYLNLAKAFASKSGANAQDVVGSFSGTPHPQRSEQWFIRELRRTADIMTWILTQDFGQARTATEIAMGLVTSDLRNLLRQDQVFRLSALGYAAYVAGEHAGLPTPSRRRLDVDAEDTWPPVSRYDEWIFDPLSSFLELNRAGSAERAEEVTEAFSVAIFGAIRARLKVALHFGWQLERMTQQELHEGQQLRSEVLAERRFDLEALGGHLNLGKTSLRYMRLLDPDNPVMNSLRTHEVDVLTDELRDLMKRYDGMSW